MILKIDPQPWMNVPETKTVMAALRSKGSTVRFVGGCVRDALLKLDAHDIDIATPDPPEIVRSLLTDSRISVIPTGIKHGTITATVGNYSYQITSLRVDVVTDGRHAEVAYITDWALDASRRDFTINALFCGSDGVVYDPFGGVDDLRAGKVRFVGDPCARIREDVLRLLRFFRFFAYYGRPPADSSAVEACETMIDKIHTLSSERIRDEMLKLLAAPNPNAAISLMYRHNILSAVLPEATRLDRLRALSSIESESPIAKQTRSDGLLRLAAVVEIDTVGISQLAKRMHFSKTQLHKLTNMLRRENTISSADNTHQQRTTLYRLGRESFVDNVYLSWSDALSHADQDWRLLKNAFKPMLKLANEWMPPTLPVNGNDVVAAGIAEGPKVANVLKKVEKWWIESGFTADRNETLAKINEIVERRLG